MDSVAHYTITRRIHVGADTVVCAAYRNADHAPVALKMTKGDYPSARAVARLKHEHAILKDLDIAGVVRTYGLVQQGRAVALVLEDAGGETLHSLLKTRALDLKAALELGCWLSGTLAALHARHIVHKDINPHHILVQADLRGGRLVDFGIATGLPRECPSARSPDLLEGTLSYMSPEQTGRMSRTLDHRTDLYSLGVTLYEILTRHLPFQSPDPMELVHSHIAQMPVPPHEVVAGIPEPVSRVVMKLLAKAAEDRYQSAGGLKADLEQCLAQLSATGRIAPFPLGRQDQAAELHLTQKLYGRSEPLANLVAAWDRARRGAAELVLVAGRPGTGRAALVHALHPAIAQGGGYFVAGKCEPLGRAIPFAPLVHAFRELVRQLLTEPVEAVVRWRDRLIDAVGSDGQVLIDLIPEVGLVIGPQPPVPELGPAESQNRFLIVFRELFQVIATADHPLAMWLDDLQWIDPASLKLLDLLLGNPDRAYLLVLGSVRESELNAAHPLAAAIERMRVAGAAVSEIALGPLGLADVEQLLADSLGCEPANVRPLATILLDKTQGNPFFLNQLIEALHENKWLRFDQATRCWVWDGERIQQMTPSDNVVDFIAERIRRLSPRAQRTLMLAACIGHHFDLWTLSIVSEASASHAAASLSEPLHEGLVLANNPEHRFMVLPGEHEKADQSRPVFDISYRFLHDRVQQAAYSLIDDDDRQRTHLQIGRLLLAESDGNPLDQELFDTMRHLNLGATLIEDPNERLVVARLNLAAGRRAKAATAYQAAAAYAKAGRLLLDGTSWREHYELTLSLYTEEAECGTLIGAFEEAESLCAAISTHATSDVDRARACRLRAMACGPMDTYDAAAISS